MKKWLKRFILSIVREELTRREKAIDEHREHIRDLAKIHNEKFLKILTNIK